MMTKQDPPTLAPSVGVPTMGRNGEYYVKAGAVWKSPIFRRNAADNGDTVTIGFKVCTPSEWIDAGTLAGVFNEHAALATKTEAE